MTTVLRTLRYLGQQGLAVRGKRNEDLSKEDLINEGKFKELFDVMCKSNNTLQGLFKKHKKIATLSSETIQNDLVTLIVTGVLNEF